MLNSSTAVTHEAMIQASWARCRAFGLDHGSAPDFAPLPEAQLVSLLARHSALLNTTDREVLPYYENILSHSSCLIRLSDGDGRLIRAWGARRLTDPRSHPGLLPGACWAERNAGTNAIGTALACGQAVHIDHDEHFLLANRFMSGSAAPIIDEQRCQVAVLDVFSDSYLPPSHTLGMVRMMAQSIENRLIRNAHGERHFLLTLNTGLSNLDSPWAGLLVFDTQGQILAANQRADNLLGQALPGQSLEALFKLPLAQVLENPPLQPFTLLAAGRNRLQCLLHKPLTVTIGAASALQKIPRTPISDPQVEKSLRIGGRLLEKDIALLVRGETGVGKEWLVRALHAGSSRCHQPLVAVNCAAIPAELVESELFGYDKGAFTGASHKGNPGLIRKADKGILFLDEIADMPLATQARLLRMLQERCIQPLGAGEPVAIDIRVISASHRDLRQQVRAGHFREDLYYRLAGTTLCVPPLRERTDRLALIAQLSQQHQDPGTNRPFSPGALDLLLRHPWPGNVRQLNSVIQVALAMAEGAEVLISDLPEEFLADFDRASDLGTPPPSAVVHPEDLSQMLQATDGNISQLARRLGVSRNTLYKRLREGKAN